MNKISIDGIIPQGGLCLADLHGYKVAVSMGVDCGS